VSGTKSSPNLAKPLSPEKASPSQAIPGPNPIENPQSPESVESPKTTPPSSRSYGLGATGESPIGVNFA
jgi:hypothetical protein